MKILHISHGYPPKSEGGTEFYLRSLCAAQREAGYEIVVLSGSQELRREVQIESEEIDGIRVLRLHRDDLYFDHYAKLYHPQVEQIVARVLAQEQPDLVHIHQWIRLTGNLVEIASLSGIPSVVTLHDVYSSCPRCFRVDRNDQHCERPLSVASCHDCVPRFGHESEQELRESIELFQAQFSNELAQAGQVLVACRATAEIIAANTGLAMEEFEFLAIPYEPRLSTGPRAASLPTDGEPFRFAFWGSITRRKGCEHLLLAFARLCSQGLPRPGELHLYGAIESQSLATRLADLAKRHPVQIHGSYQLDDLAAADLHMAVFPALGFETYGLVLDEARELGLPCILSDLGAMPMRAGAGALCVPPGDVDALAKAMRGILESPRTWRDLRAQLPLASPTPAEHVKALGKVYRAAALRPVPEGVAELGARRVAFLLMQRESALGKICPEGGPR